MNLQQTETWVPQPESNARQRLTKMMEQVTQILTEKVKQYGQNSQEFKKVYKEYLDVYKSMQKLNVLTVSETQQELLRLDLELTNMEIAAQSSGDKTLEKFSSKLWLCKTVRQEQEENIHKLLGSEKGFWNGYIQWHNEEIGNFVMTISEFEVLMKNPSTKIDGANDDETVVNAKLLWNYIAYLLDANKNEKLHVVIAKFKEVVGDQRVRELVKIWRTHEHTIVKDMMLNDPAGRGQEILALLGNAGNFFENPKHRNTVMSLSDDVFENELKDYINAHKNERDFAWKFLTFYQGIKPWSCSLEAKAFLDSISEEIKQWKTITQQDVKETQQKNTTLNEKAQWEIEDFLAQELWLNRTLLNHKSNFGLPESSLNTWPSDMTQRITKKKTLNTESNKMITKDELFQKIDSLWETQLNRLLEYIEWLFERKEIGSCYIKLFSDEITFEELYKEIHLQFREKLKERKVQWLDKLITSQLLEKRKATGKLTPQEDSEKKQIIAKIGQELDSLNCLTTTFKNIDDILVSHWLKPVWAKTRNEWANLMRISNDIKIYDAKYTLNTPPPKAWSPEEKTLLDELKLRERIDTNLNRISKATDSEFQDFMSQVHQWVDPQNAMKNLITTQDLRLAQESAPQEITYPSGATLRYVKTWENYQITTTVGNVEVNSRELQTLQKSERSAENLNNFRNTLQELDIEKLWDYREEIFKSMQNKDTLTFDWEDDFLNTNELRKFLLTIMKSVGVQNLPQENIPRLKQSIKDYNHQTFLAGNPVVNLYQESLLEATFINKFDKNRDGKMDFYAFSKSIAE